MKQPVIAVEWENNFGLYIQVSLSKSKMHWKSWMHMTWTMDKWWLLKTFKGSRLFIQSVNYFFEYEHGYYPLCNTCSNRKYNQFSGHFKSLHKATNLSLDKIIHSYCISNLDVKIWMHKNRKSYFQILRFVYVLGLYFVKNTMIIFVNQWNQENGAWLKYWWAKNLVQIW